MTAATIAPPSNVARQLGYLTTTALVDSVDGLTHRQLDHWVRCGYLEPDGEAHPGSGYARTWSADEVAVVRRMVRLVAIGFQPFAAVRHARLGVGCHELAPDIFLEVGP